MAVTSALIFSQKGTSRNSKKTPTTTCTTIAKTMEKLRLKNGKLLTMNPREHTGWTIVDAGRITQAQISEVIIVRAVVQAEKRTNIALNLVKSHSRSTKRSPVKKYTFSKRAPGSKICASRKNNTT